jgi:hypothetical protein
MSYFFLCSILVHSSQACCQSSHLFLVISYSYHDNFDITPLFIVLPHWQHILWGVFTGIREAVILFFLVH